MKTIKLIEKRDDEPSPFRLIFTLGIAGLISGLAIIAIYEATFETIKAYKAETLKKAVFKVLPGTAQIEKMRYVDGRLQATTSEEVDEDTIYAGYDSKGTLLGYAITAEGPGFQDIIGLLYGYLPDKRVIVGMAVLESRETPGLGDKIYKDADFQANFIELAVDPTIITVKKGKKSAPNEVDEISGATISSKAVVRIINESNEKWLERLSVFSNQ